MWVIWGSFVAASLMPSDGSMTHTHQTLCNVSYKWTHNWSWLVDLLIFPSFQTCSCPKSKDWKSIWEIKRRDVADLFWETYWATSAVWAVIQKHEPRFPWGQIMYFSMINAEKRVDIYHSHMCACDWLASCQAGLWLALSFFILVML